MTSFTIFGDSTAPQSLLGNEKGFIGQNGALATVGFLNSIYLNGSIDVAILGSVTSLGGDCISGSVDSFGSVLVGATGQVLSSLDDAVEIDFVGFLKVVNHGLISANSMAILTFARGADSDCDIRNTGTITAESTAVSAILGTGTFRLVTSGTIFTAGLETDSAIVVSCGVAEFRNSGTIIGDVRIATSTGQVSTIANTGLIDGLIVLGNGNDTFENLGGRVTGSVDGGAGDDTYRIDDGSIVIIDSVGGTDNVFASVTYELSNGIERLFLTGTDDIRGYGSALDNQVSGNAGDNRIAGGRGNDALYGGGGDDTLRGGSGADTLSFDAGDDVLDGSGGIDTYELVGATTGFVVNLTTGTATGDETDSDNLANIENVAGGSAADIITGSALANNLQGGGGNDSIAGGSGNDTIAGGSGIDVLTGDSGDDSFVFAAFSNSPSTTPDRITDFVPGDDIIDLSLIDANGNVAGDGAFALGGAVFLPPGQASVRVTQDSANNRTLIDMRDTSGTAIDMRIELTGLHTLTAADFIL